MDKPLNVHQAAEWLGISHWQVYRYIKAGMLKAHKLGKEYPNSTSRQRWLINRKDLEAFAYKNPNVKG
jgi:excisionase family DNA binding protein